MCETDASLEKQEVMAVVEKPDVEGKNWNMVTKEQREKREIRRSFMSVQLHGTASKELLSSLGFSLAILRPANSAGTRINGGGRRGRSRQAGEAAEKEEETRHMMKGRWVRCFAFKRNKDKRHFILPVLWVGIEAGEERRSMGATKDFVLSFVIIILFLKELLSQSSKEVEREDGGKKKNRWRSLLSAWSNFL